MDCSAQEVNIFDLCALASHSGRRIGPIRLRSRIKPLIQRRDGNSGNDHFLAASFPVPVLS